MPQLSLPHGELPEPRGSGDVAGQGLKVGSNEGRAGCPIADARGIDEIDPFPRRIQTLDPPQQGVAPGKPVLEIVVMATRMASSARLGASSVRPESCAQEAAKLAVAETEGMTQPLCPRQRVGNPRLAALIVTFDGVHPGQIRLRHDGRFGGVVERMPCVLARAVQRPHLLKQRSRFPVPARYRKPPAPLSAKSRR